jgi:quercetin dioxygenase-like cupin family protein
MQEGIMAARWIFKPLSFLGVAVLFAACSDQTTMPTAVMEDGSSKQTLQSMSAMESTVAPLALEPFTFRASLDPFKIHQPGFMMRSTATTDIVMQRLEIAPGTGAWHTHPGPSFIYVIEGEIKLERFSKKDGCTATPVFDAGEAYSEVADEVHRAVVVSAGSAVLLVTRFNIPVGAALSNPAADPGC